MYRVTTTPDDGAADLHHVATFDEAAGLAPSPRHRRILRAMEDELAAVEAQGDPWSLTLRSGGASFTIETAPEETRDVIFRTDKDDGTVTAVFPSEAAELRSDLMSCYAHIGQHSACSLQWYYDSTRPATEDEYRDLLRELEERYGPHTALRVVKRMTSRHRNDRRQAATR